MDIEQIKRIKELAVIAMFSDDELLDILVLKGGSAIDMFLQSPGRASLDLDFSIDGDFHEDVESLRNKFERLLSSTFDPAGFVVFDVCFKAIPPVDVVELPFWGGYKLEFKLAPPLLYDEYKDKLRKLRRRLATDVGPRQLKTFTIEFSKHEHCSGKEERELDHFTIYTYPPLMLACEKIRAICQQDPDYRKRLGSRPGSQRARDFFDIHFLSTTYDIDWESSTTFDLLRSMFKAKYVPLTLLRKLSESRELRDFHMQGFPSVKDTVLPGHNILEFDVYFDFVLECVSMLKPLWDK